MSRLNSRLHSVRLRGLALALVTLATHVALVAPNAEAATPVAQRINLRVLLLDDDSHWVDALETQMVVEGIPFTAVKLGSARPEITPAFLAAGDTANFQAVIAPEHDLVDLSADERTALREFEARFGVREVDGYDGWANPSIGLNWAVWSGEFTGTASVTDAGRGSGFGYLNGPVPYGRGSWTSLAEPLTARSDPPLPPGASFTTLVSAPIPGTARTGSVIGVYANGGAEQMIITSAFNFFMPQFKPLAHGILRWATRGVHLGYNRSYFTVHVDDTFSSVNTWDVEHNCTPGEDCPIDPATGASIYEPIPHRMTPQDVTFATQWQAANDYTLTMAFNAFYAGTKPGDDQLTDAFRANAGAFKWLNHGFEHIFQGCVQDFTVIPWRCETDGNGNILYESQSTVFNEIQTNIAAGQALGLSFDPTEYQSGEHSGLASQPQMPVDNPNFGPALTQAGILTIGSDASREPTSRRVGSAVAVPRHPMAIYYNASTIAQEVDEYNWLYTTRADGGSGNCEDNPQTTTCISPLDPATGFQSHIVPTDAAFSLSFVLANDPRPFYAHVTNLGDDRILYPVLERMLGTYRAAFSPSAPLLNLTLTEAATVLERQKSWATDMGDVSGYVENGTVTIASNGRPVPLTVPEGTTVNGVSLESYGGELSGWLPGSATGTLPSPSLTISGSTEFRPGTTSTINITASGSPAPSIAMTGALPTGLVFTPGTGTATISGSPSSGTSGSYPITVTATSGSARVQEQVTLTVVESATFTSPASTTASAGTPFSFAVTTSGSPTPTLSSTGTLPAGVTFTANTDGTGTLAGTPAATAGGTYPITFTAQSTAGTTAQAFTLTVDQAPAFTSASSATAGSGASFSFTVTTTGFPASTMTSSGTLPSGITFTPNTTNGTATLAGTTTAAGTYPLTFTATNASGTATQSFTLTVTAAAAPPVFTSAPAATARVGTPFTFTVTTSGNPPPTMTGTGTLPTGITFTANADGTGTLAGTAAAGTGGNYSVTFQATNASGSRSQTFALRVEEAPAITSATTANATVGTSFSFVVRTSGFPRATLSVAGSLPSGITFTPNTNGTGTLSGTPTGAGATYPLTFTAENSVGTTTQSFTLTVREVPTITSPATLTLTRGQPVNFLITTTGVPTPTVSKAGSLPPGVTFTANSDGTARLEGTATKTGVFTPTIKAANSAGTASQTLRITVQ